MFHEHEKFGTLTKTNATLQALLSGDEIMNFIIPLLETYGKTGLIYSMAFCILFIICLHNVLIYIVSEAFKIQATLQKKDVMRLRKKDSIHSAISPMLPRTLAIEPSLQIRAEDTVVALELYDKKQLLAGDEDINGIKTKIFNKIIPQSRDKNILEMAAKKALIMDDIHYLKQSLQDLAAEDIDPILKTNLLLSGRLYVEFLLKRLERMTRTFLDLEYEQQDYHTDCHH